ncbi:MAG: hypothetical protein AAFZ91_00090 [Pseudomonadota bacterium]
MSRVSTYRFGLASTSVLLLSVAVSPAHADTPAAGTNIVNQATVHYTDATGADREVTTNEVVLFVQAVYSSTLEADRALAVAAGGETRFLHTLTNTGNAENTFCISANDRTGDSGDFGRIDVIYDSNGDGDVNADEQILYSSSSGSAGELVLSSGTRAGLIVQGRVPADAAVSDAFGLDLSVSSQDGTASCGAGLPDDIGDDADGLNGTNTDIATVSANAILEIAKSSDYRPGLANDLSDDQIEYTIIVRNIGILDATDVQISDTLPNEVSFDSFATTTNSENHLAGIVTAQAATLMPDDEVEVRFVVDVDPTLGFSGEDLEIENSAQVEANLDGVAGLEPAIPSNTVLDEIDPVYGVVLSDTGGSASPGVNDGADDDATINDVQLVDVSAPGDVARFTLTATNTGNTIDTYNISDFSRAGWFSDAGLRYLSADFATPLLDTTGDGISDTGPLAPGESLTFMVSTSLSYTEPSSPHTLSLRAISTAELSGGAVNVSDLAGLAIGSGLAPGVDIANSASAAGFNDAGGVNADPDSAITTTLVAAPGGSVLFDLFVANEGSSSDSFSLSGHANSSATLDLPDGWGVRFLAVDGTPISATPLLEAGTSYAFQAEVTTPDNVSDSVLQSVFFRAASLNAGVSDIKQDAVSISAAPAISLTPDQFGQIAACGRKEYLHTLINSGGTQEDITLSLVSQSNLLAELRLPTRVEAGEPVGYEDLSFLSVGSAIAVLSDGTWATVTLVADGGSGFAVPMAAGDETRILVRVIAGCEVASGTVDTLRLKAETTDADAISRATDTTTVASARINVTKLGALDAGCLGGADTAFDDARVQAGPGDCVIWQITLRNSGVEPVCNVVARDTAPSFTSIFGTPLITQQPSPGTGSCNLNGNTIACSVGNSFDIDNDSSSEDHCLLGGEQAQVEFLVMIE